MLERLSIANLVTVEGLELEFGPGLTVITGDTGAGKSVLLDALDLALGGRADFGLIRAGAPRSTVSASFTVTDAVRERLAAVEAWEDRGEDVVILTRELAVSGRSSARLDGVPVPAGVLREIGERLVDLVGQSEHLSLLRPATHRALLDAYGRHEAVLTAYQAAWGDAARLAREIDRRTDGERDRAQRIDYLRFLVGEISEAGLEPGEDDALEQERRRYQNLQRLQDALAAALAALDDDQAGAQLALGVAGRAVGQVAGYDPELDAAALDLSTAAESVAEVARRLRRVLDSLEADPVRVTWVEERLATIRRLARKYGPSIGDVLATAGQAEQELAQLEGQEVSLEELQEQLGLAWARVADHGQVLHEARQAASGALGAALASHLADLGLAGVRFETWLRPLGEGLRAPDGTYWQEAGGDDVAFALSVNPGEPVRPLASVASGGEMARILLALSVVLGRNGGVPVQVFDEVDAGVGGRSGGMVGRKLAELSREVQVIVVSHLPQVAAYADQQLLVTKEVVGERTVTHCVALDEDHAVRELAGMLGLRSAATEASARELLGEASAWKRTLQETR